MTGRVRNLSNARLLWLVPIALAVHNAEEAVGVRLLDTSTGLLSAWRRAWGDVSGGYLPLDLALAALTLGVFVVAALGDLADPQSRGARAVLVVQVVMVINAFWHLSAAIVLRGYAPGLFTALLVEIPVSRVVLGRSWRERWLSRRATVITAVVVAVLHLVPGLVLVARVGRGS